MKNEISHLLRPGKFVHAIWRCLFPAVFCRQQYTGCWNNNYISVTKIQDTIMPNFRNSGVIIWHVSAGRKHVHRWSFYEFVSSSYQLPNYCFVTHLFSCKNLITAEITSLRSGGPEKRTLPKYVSEIKINIIFKKVFELRDSI